MITACGQQLRVAAAGAFGLDFGAVMAVGAARQVDMALLADVLPHCEIAILMGRQSDEGEQGDGGE